MVAAESEPPAAVTISSKIAELLERGEVAVLVTVARGENVGAKLLVEEAARTTGTLGSAELDSLVAAEALQFLISTTTVGWIFSLLMGPCCVKT